MLIDLYERPYSPEASKSRAFIDSILALSGPDGGVVGGEDGVSTQRPLKDGGREAWDMIRRLRQKAWQKAGLNPQMLWSEKDQIQAGIASPADPCRDEDSTYSAAFQPESLVSNLNGASSVTNPQPSNPHKPFNVTRPHTSSDDVTSNDPNPLLPFASNTQFHANPASPSIPPRINSINMATSSNSPPSTQYMAAAGPGAPIQQAALDTAASSGPSFMDSSSRGLPMSVPTPPSMVDPNLNFDWDQWDAVFGQHLPVADDLMELDPVSGLGFTHAATAPITHGNNPMDVTHSYGNGSEFGSRMEIPSRNGSNNDASKWESLS